MSIPAPCPPDGLSVRAVARATGLDLPSVYRAAGEAQLGSPAHFRYAGTQIVYTFAGLCQLVQGLEALGYDGAARLLRELVGQARQAAASAERLTTPTAPAVESWLSAFERRQEEDQAA